MIPEIPIKGLKAVITPTEVAIAFPPLNLLNKENMCPKIGDIAKREIFIVGFGCKKVFVDGSISQNFEKCKQIVSGTNPLQKSNKNTNIPHFFPKTLKALVAPIFPEPVLRKSFCCTNLPITKPVGIDPKI